MKYNITLEGITYEIEVELDEARVAVMEEYEAVPSAIGKEKSINMAEDSHLTIKQIDGTAVVAPLPGNILSIKANIGEKVKSGQVLLIIEAMKMENEVVSPVDGIVKEIEVKKGQAVSSGATLLILDR